jgi:hypothetical protein
LHHDNAPSHIFFSTSELFCQKQQPHPPYFSLFPRLKIKLKSHHYDRSGVTEAEPQAVLNTLTEHDFQDAFKNGRRLEMVHMH